MINERLRRYGATLSTAAALGGLVTAAADARPSTSHVSDTPEATHISGNEPPAVPKGVRSADHLSPQEVGETLKKINKRWDGVLVLHAPKKNVFVGFTESPSYYLMENPELYMTGNKTTVVAICPRPAIEKIHGRDYAIAYDTVTSNWAFLDLDYAEESGALSSYAFKGHRPKLIPYPLQEQQADMPVINDISGYGANWLYGTDNRAEKLLSIYLPTNIDPNKKQYDLVPSNIMPHS